MSTTTTDPDVEVLASGSAMPKGNPQGEGDRARASARVYARIRARESINGEGATVGSFNRFPAAFRAVLWVVWGDFRDSWIRTDSTPTLGTYLAGERSLPAPYGKRWLRLARLVWAYTGGAAFTLAGHGLAYVGQSPIRSATFVVALGGMYLIRQLGGMP